jgi:hypothetical protein
MKSQENSRRQFLIRGLVSVAALPFAGAMLSATASAAALKPLPANNPQAVAREQLQQLRPVPAGHQRLRHLCRLCRRAGRLVLGLGQEGLIPGQYWAVSEYETAMP